MHDALGGRHGLGLLSADHQSELEKDRVFREGCKAIAHLSGIERRDAYKGLLSAYDPKVAQAIRANDRAQDALERDRTGRDHGP